MISPADLVTPTHVHRSVYTDPAIFVLEIERIFGRSWLYLAHDSELKRPGDYVVRHMGTQAVILTRSADGDVAAIFNRCSHRGATLCAFDRGQAPQGHTCPYHGWRFAADGTLKSVSHKVNYDGVLDPAEYAIDRVARIDTYRGFIFGNLSANGPGLVDFLGHMATTIDDLVDRSPTGEVECGPHVLRHYYRGNWKMTFENLNDTVHPGFAHAASVVSARAVAQEVGADNIAPTLGMMMANGKPLSFFQNLDMMTVPGGHSYIGGHMGATYAPDTADAYTAALIARNGAAETARILGTDRHVMLLYPSTWHARYQTVRIVRPVRHDLTEVIGYTFRLVGAPEATYVNAIEYCTGANSAASPVIADDLELYERLMLGNRQGARDWIPMSRGLNEDRERTNALTRTPSTSEAFIRNQYSAWAALMAA